MPRTGALARHAVGAIHPRRPLPGVVAGAVAGAAGTTVLNTVTYLDMALRGRPSSSAPQEVVEKLADRAGVGIPGSGETKQNRLQGLGPLTGTAVGLAVGVAAGGVHRFLLARGLATEDDLERTESKGCLSAADPDAVSDQAYKRGHDQCGTLGSGNHFGEVQIVDQIFDADVARALVLEWNSDRAAHTVDCKVEINAPAKLIRDEVLN